MATELVAAVETDRPWNGTILSDGHRLARYLVAPSSRDASLAPTAGLPAFLLCHGFPSAPLTARQSGVTFPELVDRVRNTLEWPAMTFTFRGCGDSEGSFSAQGWLNDLRAAIDHLEEQVQPSEIFLAGTSTGGALGLCVAATDPRIRGLALLGVPAHFDHWIADPNRLLKDARDVGAIRDDDFPESFDSWKNELGLCAPTEAARQLARRPVLLLHGDEDDVVPLSDVHVLAEAHGSAEVRVIKGGGHRLRHDPRAVAMLLGWLERSAGQ